MRVLLDVTVLCDVYAQSILVEFKSTAGQKIALYVLVSCVITKLQEWRQSATLTLSEWSTAYDESSYCRLVYSNFFATTSFFYLNVITVQMLSVFLTLCFSCTVIAHPHITSELLVK